jgi:hypothetical protein
MSHETLKRDMNSDVRFFLSLIFKGSDTDCGTKLLLKGRESLHGLILKRKRIGFCLGTVESKDY